jgi:hypothetical protein
MAEVMQVNGANPEPTPVSAAPAPMGSFGIPQDKETAVKAHAKDICQRVKVDKTLTLDAAGIEADVAKFAADIGAPMPPAKVIDLVNAVLREI